MSTVWGFVSISIIAVFSGEPQSCWDVRIRDQVSHLEVDGVVVVRAVQHVLQLHGMFFLFPVLHLNVQERTALLGDGEDLPQTKPELTYRAR